MGLAQPAYGITEEEFLQGEEVSDIRYEYADGQVYAMAGATDRHNLITVNVATLFNNALPDHCEIFAADLKVRIQTQTALNFYYPDVMVCCAEERRQDIYREHPCLIVEVLSRSTARLDRLEKFWAYQQIPTLQEYLLLAQDVQEATLFRRAQGWQAEVYRTGEFYLAAVDLTVSLDAFYRRVRF